MTSGGTTTYAAGLLAGVDLQAPTIRFSPASPKANDEAMRDFQVQVSDQGSGIRATDPVTAKVSRRDAQRTTDLSSLSLAVALPLVETMGLPGGNVGYYTFTAKTVDKAGNSSGDITRTAVHDDTDPITGVIVGAYDDKTGRYSITGTVTDNLSIKEYWAEARFGPDPTLALGGNLSISNGGLFLPQEGAVSVDAYNAPALTTSQLASGFMVRTYRALQVLGGGWQLRRSRVDRCVRQRPWR